jgi:uncharacterized membrane protein HdeD (DUF308 family)
MGLTKIIKRWVSFWDVKLKELEQGELLRTKVLSSRLYTMAMRCPTAHDIILSLVKVFFIAWGVVGGMAALDLLEGRPEQ